MRFIGSFAFEERLAQRIVYVNALKMILQKQTRSSLTKVKTRSEDPHQQFDLAGQVGRAIWN